MTVDEYKKLLLTEKVEDIYNHYVIAGDVWYFKERYDNEWFYKYNEFKLFVSKNLGVHYNDVAIAGSAKIGFSLNPSKEYKPFDDESDIDIIVISQSLFYRFWKEYLKDSYSVAGIKNYTYICKCIFRKFITFEGFSKNNKIYANWEKKTKGFEKDLQLQFGIKHDVHYRIYESWEAAQMYYVSSMLKNRIKLEEQQHASY